ncbi:T9SS type A sorting domain-containing protein [Flavobacteriaceae bacterium GSB9]|nr:T9SS type A sorting domain-containing protein [Flavobacteriaceae bacterium GSB9]
MYKITNNDFIDLVSKSYKTFVLCCLSLLCFGLSTQSFYAQDVGSSTVQANFGVEADVYSGVLQFPNVGNPVDLLPGDPSGIDDWFEGPSGLGVIDEFGSANGGNPDSDPDVPNDTDNVAIELRQSVWNLNVPGLPFPVVLGNGTPYLWLDAVYGRDTYTSGGSAETSYFAGGADKNSNNPANWTIGTMGSVPQKTDIVDVYAHLRGTNPHDPTTNPGFPLDDRPFDELFAYAGASLAVTNGNKHLDFEFFRVGLETVADLSNPAKLGPDAGRTAWTFDPDGADNAPGGGDDGEIMIPGTIIVSVDYINGGNVPSIRIRVWMSETTFNNYDNTWDGRPFNVDKNVAFEQEGDSGEFGYAAINPKDPTVTNMWGRANDNFVDAAGSTTLGPPWGTFEGSGPDWVTDYERYQFVEIGLNLTAFGLDRRGVQDPCSNILGSLLVKTRSSGGGPNESAFGSELKDFAGPYLFGFLGGPPEIAADPLTSCEDGDDQHAFDLTTAIDEANSTPEPDTTRTFHESEADADNLMSSGIGTPGSYSVSVGDSPKTIWIRSVRTGSQCYSKTSFTVTVYDQPTAGTGQDDSYCETEDVSNVDLFALLTGEDAGGQWTDANGNVSSPIDLSGYALDTTHTFTYTVGANGDCPGDNESVDIIIYSQPTAGTSQDDSYCETEDVSNVDLFALLTGEDAGGQWTDANGNVSSPIDLSAYALDTTHTFTYTVGANGDCPGDNESVDIIIYSQPTAGTGQDDSYCETEDVSNVDLFALLTGEDAGGQWTDANGNVSSPIDLSAYALDTTHTFTYTVGANGDCPGDNESVDIIIYSQPTAGTGQDDSYCETEDVSNVDLFALLTGEDAGGQWTDANGNVSSPIDLSAYALDTTHTFTYTVGANGDCPGDNESVDIIIYSQPTAGTGQDDSYCETEDVSNVDLFALLTGEDAGGQWTDANGNVSSPIDLSAYALDTTHTFTYTVGANGDCPGDNESVDIIIYSQPTAGAGQDDSYCETEDVSNVDLFALLTGEDAGGQWTYMGGNVNSPIDLSAYALDTTHTFTYTVGANGDCPGDDESVDIIIYGDPTAGTGQDDSYCETEDVSNVDLFALLTGEDAGGQWTDANGNVSSPIDLSAYALDTTHTFTYTVGGNGDCPGDDESVDIIIYSQPTAGTGQDDSYCETEDVSNVDLFALLTGEDAGGQWTDANGNVSSPIDLSAYALDTTHTFTYTVGANGDCPGDNESVDIIIYSQPTAGTGQDDSYCETEDVSNVDLFALLTGEDAGGQWTDANGNVSSPIDLSAYALDTTHTFTYTVGANGDCPGDNESVDIIIYSQPTAGTGQDDSYCETEDVSNVDLFALLTGEDAGGQWTDANGNVSSPIDLSAYALDTTHTFTYTVGANGDCPGDNESVDIIIYSQPTAGTGQDDSYCETEDVSNVDLFALLTGEDAGGQWTDANGNVSSPIDLSAYALDTTHTFTYTVGANGDCPGDNESVDIIIYSQPTAGTGQDDSYCETEDVSNVDLFALLTGEDAGGQWTDANGNVSSPIDLSAYALDTTHTFTYTVGANGDCPGDNESVDIIIYSQPTAGTGQDDAYCESDSGLSSVDLDALLSGEDAGGQWTYMGGNVSSPIDLGAYATGDHTFTYTVAANGDCPADDEDVVITINPNPGCTAANSSEGLELGLCLGQTLGLSVTPADTNLYTYQWTSNGSAIITNADMPNATADNVADGEVFTVRITSKTAPTFCYSECTTTARYYDCAPNCETAFGVETMGPDNDGFYSVNPDVSSCFRNDGFRRWGWTNKITEEGTYEFELFRGAGRCDLSKGTHVGWVRLYYGEGLAEPGEVVVEYDLFGDGETFVISEAHVWVGCDPYPKTKSGAYTVAPGQYSFNSGDLGYVDDKLITPPIQASGDFYFIAHAVVCDYDVPNGAELPGLANTYEFDMPNAPFNEAECNVNTDGWGKSSGDKVSFTAYPVPFENEVNVGYKFEYDTNVKIDVYDIKGALIRQAENNSYIKGTYDTTTIDLSRTDDQLYFIKLSTSKEILVKKIVSSTEQ